MAKRKKEAKKEKEIVAVLCFTLTRARGKYSRAVQSNFLCFNYLVKQSNYGSNI